MNWGDLKKLAISYTHRPSIDYDACQTPACDRLTQLLDTQDNETIGSGAMTTTPDQNNLFSFALPIDYGRMKTVLINGVRFAAVPLLTLIDDQSSALYAVSGSTIYAAASGTIAFAYGRQIDPIVGDSGTSVILSRYPRVYLYAVVIEAYIQVQDFDAAQGYQAAFDAAVDDVNGLQAFARYDAAARPMTGFGRI